MFINLSLIRRGSLICCDTPSFSFKRHLPSLEPEDMNQSRSSPLPWEGLGTGRGDEKGRGQGLHGGEGGGSVDPRRWMWGMRWAMKSTLPPPLPTPTGALSPSYGHLCHRTVPPTGRRGVFSTINVSFSLCESIEKDFATEEKWISQSHVFSWNFLGVNNLLSLLLPFAMK